MSKAITHAVRSVRKRRLGMDKEMLRIACDDGTTYEFRRPNGSDRWRSFARWGKNGARSAEPSRLPRAVVAHMDGRTGGGPYGEDSDEYWVA